MDDLVSTRRSTASSLNKNESGEKISLKSMMPPHKGRTVELQYEEDEAAEAERFRQVHRDDGDFCRPKNLFGRICSEGLRYKFNPDDPWQSKVVLLAAYDSHAARIVVMKIVRQELR